MTDSLLFGIASHRTLLGNDIANKGREINQKEERIANWRDQKEKRIENRKMMCTVTS
jgi:hypothetical protein